jgi:hypothetical protein
VARDRVFGPHQDNAPRSRSFHAQLVSSTQPGPSQGVDRNRRLVFTAYAGAAAPPPVLYFFQPVLYFFQ